MAHPNPVATSIILAGGQSSRLRGDKTQAIIGTESLLQRVIGCLTSLSTEIIVVTSPKQESFSLPLHPTVKKVTDVYPGKSSLGGIYSGLVASSCFHSLVVACDMPLLNIALLRYMLDLSPDFDVVIPRIGEYMEPLHAVYSKNCLATIKVMLERGNLKITDFFDQVKVRYVAETEINKFDPEHLSFFNINTKTDLERAQALIDSTHSILSGREE